MTVLVAYMLMLDCQRNERVTDKCRFYMMASNTEIQLGVIGKCHVHVPHNERTNLGKAAILLSMLSRAIDREWIGLFSRSSDE